MDFNFDTGSIYGGLQTLDVTTLPPLGGQAGVLTITGTGALTLPGGTTAQQPGTPSAGMFRYNNQTTKLEYYNGTIWDTLSTATGSVSSVAASSTSSSLTVTGSPITSAGTFEFTLDAGLEALGTFNTTGILVATGDNTWDSVTITGTASNIVVTDGSGIAGNPTIDLAPVTQADSGDFVKVTLDSFGRVTGNTAVVAADITALVDSTYVNVSGDTMASGADLTFVGGGEVLGLPTTPSGDTAATSKAYVDAVAAGLSWKQAVQAATTGPLTLASDFEAGDTLDGYVLDTGDRILIKNQTTTTENGIYVVSATGAPVRATDMDAVTPINEVNGAATFVENGTVNGDTAWVETATVTTIGTDPIVFAQFSGSGTYTAGTGLTLTGTVFSLSSPVATSLGGTGLTAAPAEGQLLIGNGTGYTLATLTDGTGITITEAAGSITIANAGVVSLTGTANEVEVSASTGAVTVGLPSDVTVSNSLTVSGLTANGAIYAGTGGLLSSTAALTDGQILIGSTGLAPVAGTLTGGTGITVTNAAGSITIDIDNTEVVTSFSGGTTGLTPATATSGAITLGGTLAVANGGTGLTALGTANQVFGVNADATAAEYKTLTAGTGMSIVHGANVVTFNNTGVTSVALTAPSIFTVSGSPVTTTGTLDFALNTQVANTVFAGPATGVDAAPTFRALGYADLPIELYVENPVSAVAPVASGDNAVAVGSGSSATAEAGFAVGAGSSARIEGQKAFANGSFATAGDAQHGVYVARNITTDATVTELFLDGAATQLVMPDNSLFTFDIMVAGRRTDATGGGAGYRFVGVARKDATSGSVTFVGTPSKTVIGETNTAWDAAVAVDTATGAIKVSVTGESAKTIRWVATILTTEVTN